MSSQDPGAKSLGSRDFNTQVRCRFLFRGILDQVSAMVFAQWSSVWEAQCLINVAAGSLLHCLNESPKRAPVTMRMI